MSEPEPDAAVSQRYRELAGEEPPSALDAEILAAARGERDLGLAPLVAPTGRRRWYVPLAAAAVIVLSVVVTVQLQGERPDPELASGEAVPASPASAPAPQPSMPSRADAAREAPKEAAAALRRSPERPRATAQEAAPAAAAASGAAEPAKLAHDAPAPEEWLARIARLRRDARHAEADREFAAFLRRYPDFRIPEALHRQVLPR